jgi:hypothetical protein
MTSSDAVIREPQSVARLRKTFSDSLSAVDIRSRREVDHVVRDVEKHRSHLTHAQGLEYEHLEAAARFASSIPSIISADGATRIAALRRSAGMEIREDPVLP